LETFSLLGTFCISVLVIVNLRTLVLLIFFTLNTQYENPWLRHCGEVLLLSVHGEFLCDVGLYVDCGVWLPRRLLWVMFFVSGFCLIFLINQELFSSVNEILDSMPLSRLSVEIYIS
jgi:hypothetical protein